MTDPTSLKSILDLLDEKSGDTPTLTSRQRRARTVARLAAVQALYQMELAGEGVDTVIEEFSRHRFDGDIEGQMLAEAEEIIDARLARMPLNLLSCLMIRCAWSSVRPPVYGEGTTVGPAGMTCCRSPERCSRFT